MSLAPNPQCSALDSLFGCKYPTKKRETPPPTPKLVSRFPNGVQRNTPPPPPAKKTPELVSRFEGIDVKNFSASKIQTSVEQATGIDLPSWFVPAVAVGGALLVVFLILR